MLFLFFNLYYLKLIIFILYQINKYNFNNIINLYFLFKFCKIYISYNFNYFIIFNYYYHFYIFKYIIIYPIYSFFFFQINEMLPVPFSILKICACAARNLPSFKFSGLGTFRPMLPMWLLPWVCLRMHKLRCNLPGFSFKISLWLASTSCDIYKETNGGWWKSLLLLFWMVLIALACAWGFCTFGKSCVNHVVRCIGVYNSLYVLRSHSWYLHTML